MKYNILIIDDDKRFANSVKTALQNFRTNCAYSISEARNKLNAKIDVVLLDLVFDIQNPDHLEGLEFLPYIRENYPDIQVIIMTNFPSKVKIGPLIKSGGALDFFIKKELDWSEWGNRIENYCRISHENRELRTRTRELEEKYDDSEIIGGSVEIDFVKRKLRDIAKYSNDISILIQGETGTGKNLSVRYFKRYSNRKNKPFIEFSISTLSNNVLESELFGYIKGAFTGADNNKKGLFEEADGGILFLDEIGDYDLNTQKKIMKFIEDKTIRPVGSTKSKRLDIQLIMATNQNIPELIESGEFREDLYQRINQIKIELPPLRVRKGDIEILANYFFNQFKVKEKTNLISMAKEVYEKLNNYQWPGNVRELQSVIWEACTNARLYNDNILRKQHLSVEISSKSHNEIINNKNSDLDFRKAKLELEAIDIALERTFGQKTEAAKLLCMSADQLRYRVLKYQKIDFSLVNRFSNVIKYYNKISKEQ